MPLTNTLLSPTVIFALLIGLAISLIVLAKWMHRKGRESLQNVSLKNHEIVLEFKGKVKQLPISDVCEIRHSWIAAVFYAANWEFGGKSGRTLKVDSDAIGLSKVLSQLEQLLPGFSVAEVKRVVSESDVHGETICVWKAAA